MGNAMVYCLVSGVVVFYTQEGDNKTYRKHSK